jgi:ribA/ribD-fused uncharacterized protein
MTDAISSFSGPHRFLSNFTPCSIVGEDGLAYKSVEHAYQAAKAINAADREKIRQAPTAGEAKRLGRQVECRSDWEAVKVGVMERLLRFKFSNPHFKALLLDTGERRLVEGNTWGDTVWGVCGGKGQNKLGELLMKVRREIRDESTG